LPEIQRPKELLIDQSVCSTVTAQHIFIANALFNADWSPWTKADAERVPYAVSKKYAELAVWEWAEANPHVDVTTSEYNIILFFLFVAGKANSS